MPKALFSTLVLALAPFTSGAQSRQVPAVGERLPPIELDGLSQTPAKSCADFYGRAVLLEFFAFWCGPCALSVPHLNELQETYGARGLSIVAVTAESPAKTEPWIAKRGAQYAYGYDPSSKVHELFAVNRIPFAVLVDPFGTIVWTGNPTNLSGELIERTLDGALDAPCWTWPEGARALLAPLVRGDYAAALEAAAKLAPSDGFDAQGVVRARIAALDAHLERLVAREDYKDALAFGARAARELGTLPEGQKIDARTKELAADPLVQAALAALERLKGLEQRAAGVKSADEAEKLRPEIESMVHELEGKKLQHRAQQLLSSLDRAIERVKKKKS